MKKQEQTNGEVAVIDKENLNVAINEAKQLPVIDMSDGNLPDLAEAKEIPLDLMANYWSPVAINESKRVFFDALKMRTVLDQQTGEALELLCAYFYEKVGEEVKTISNGSKRLVSIFENGQIPRGTPLLITYLGKKKNANNSFMSDNWSAKVLQFKV